MILSTDQFYLRTLTVDDVGPAYLSWMSDPEVNRYLEVRFAPQSLESLKSFVASFDGKSKYFFGLFDAKNDQHIGNFNLHHNLAHNTVYLGYLIGDKKYWGTPASVEAICMILDFSFDHLQTRKVWGSTYLTNIGAIFNLKRFGFTHEGTQRGQVLDGDQVTDCLFYGLLRHEWLEKRQKFANIQRTLTL